MTTALFPWGALVLPANGLELGREVGPGDLRAELDRYPNSSRRHASVVRDGSGWVVEDLGSTNGTFVDGRRLRDGERARVRPGPRVRLAARLEFTLEASC